MRTGRTRTPRRYALPRHSNHVPRLLCGFSPGRRLWEPGKGDLCNWRAPLSHDRLGSAARDATAVITTMHDFDESRSPLTNDNVQSWARTNFPAPFRALPRFARLNWTDSDKFKTSRPVYRSLGRSTHKQLLIIGGYAPGPEIDEEPTDRVVAHVHSDEAEVSFYRIAEVGESDKFEFELQPVNSTATVAFHAPFCHVGDDTGGSKAIHRVSALILYYFLAAGHVKELVRYRSDPTMFTRNFRDACAWIENEGERPIMPPSRRHSGFIASPPLCATVPVRPKRSSTICTYTNIEHN
jgi:hypothetical protein